MDALVTDTDIRGAVAGLRGLSDASLRVLAVAPHRLAAGLLSRSAAARRVVPDPRFDPAGFAGAVETLAREQGPLVVFPGREEAIDALAAESGVLGAGVLPYPAGGPVRALRDKRALADLADAAGVPRPRTLAEGTAGDVLLDPPDTPCIVKPAGAGRGAVRAASSAGELRSVLAEIGASEPVVVQELVDGPLVSLGLVLARDGRAVARFQQRALRTWPPGAGTASRAIGEAVDERLAEPALALLREAGWWGFAQVQFIAADRPRLIDVNVGFPGSLPLALASGVNLPAAAHAVARGEEPPPAGAYQTGVTFRWLEADVAALLRGSPNALLERAPRPRVGAMWRARDPLPGIALAAGGLGERVARRLRGARDGG